ncbi:MAG: GNAT family N-acetyltransferase [Deinococcota bacterium]
MTAPHDLNARTDTSSPERLTSEQPLVVTLDRLAASVHQAEVVAQLDGWQVRYHYGVTRRANSTWPRSHQGKCGLAQKLQLVEAFYANAGQAPRFQVSPASAPHGLKEILHDRGYVSDSVTNVQVVDIETVIDRAIPKRFEVWLKPKLEPQWLEHDTRFAHSKRANNPAYRTLFENTPQPCVFASLRQDNAVIALGQCVVHSEEGFAGLFNISTRPNMRRRGVATALLHHLARWAQRQGAKQMYLQVEADNASANALYTKLGFTTCYQYEHLVKQAELM